MRETTADDRCGLFVFDFFSTSSIFLIFPKKVIGPDASEKHLWSFERVREGIWGRPGGVLGGSWAVLGRSLGDLFEQSDLGSIFGSILITKRVPKGRHLGSQNGAKIDPKTIPNRSRFSRANKKSFRVRLGGILRRSAGIWGAILGAKIGQMYWKSQYLMKIVVFEEDKHANLARFGRPKAPKREAK